MKVNYELGLIAIKDNQIITVYDLYFGTLLYKINYKIFYDSYYLIGRFIGGLHFYGYEIMEIGWML
jgi:hypothetical protein